MQHPLDAVMANPWGTLELVLGDSLHPGGIEATEELLDRADVGADTRLLDVGCGVGEAVARARARGAMAVGLDLRPRDRSMIRGDLGLLPVRDGVFDVVLAECVLCLADGYAETIAEIHRALVPGGRFALADVVLEEDVGEVPAPVAELFCLDGPRGVDTLVEYAEAGGFVVDDVRSHRADLLEMRDRLASRLDYEALLGQLGGRGAELLDGIEMVEAGIESGSIGYVSMIATR